MLPQVPLERFKIMELRKAVLVEGVTVTFFDANHCPGAKQLHHALPYLHLVLTESESQVSAPNRNAALSMVWGHCSDSPKQTLNKHLAVAGAAMILFEVPGHRPVLHTGDFR